MSGLVLKMIHVHAYDISYCEIKSSNQVPCFFARLHQEWFQNEKSIKSNADFKIAIAFVIKSNSARNYDND